MALVVSLWEEVAWEHKVNVQEEIEEILTWNWREGCESESKGETRESSPCV